LLEFPPDSEGSLQTDGEIGLQRAPEQTETGAVAGTQILPSDAPAERPADRAFSGDGLCESPDASRRPNAFRRRDNGARARPRPRRACVEASRDERTLFDLAPADTAINEHRPAGDEALGPVLAVEAPTSNSGLSPATPDLGAPAVQFTVASGEKAKARDIVAAIRALTVIEKEQRPATTSERQTLARFAGFGPVALSIFPDPITARYKDATWQEIGEELTTLLTTEEYDSAKRATFNAFYTSPTVIAAMHEAMRRLGLPEDAIVLEPGCGTGNFMSMGPPGLRFIGIEQDCVSGRIAQVLHSAQDIRIENFRDTRLTEGSVDGVIGNVPFADLKLEYRGQKLSLHDFFFAKSIDALRPGGVLALVTTHFTLDKQNASHREHLAAKADFVGAIRLPSDAFKREGTAVVTDIIFLRKRSLDEPPNHTDPQWPGVAPLAIDGMEVPINRYFLNHPEMVLGVWTRKDTLYGEGYSIRGDGNLGEQLHTAIQRLPELAPLHLSPNQARPTLASLSLPPAPHISEGSFFLRDDRSICQVIDGQVVPVSFGGSLLKSSGPLVGIRLARLLELRDRARRVLQSQNEGWAEEDRTEARRQLNDAYDRFVLNFGPINKTTTSATAAGTLIRRMPNLVKFREDPDAMLVMSLEHYDEATGKATKAAIMSKDVVGRNPPITSVRSAEEGLLVSLDQRGAVDLPFIAALYGKPEAQVIVELGDLVFHDPEHQNWQTADAYLSGNVRAKLAAVLNAGPAYARNAETLRQVQPEDVLPGDIDANLGAPWIPESDIQAFAAELFGVELTSIQVGHLLKDAVWSIAADAAAERSVAATADYGTLRAGGTWLLELALNMKTPVVYDTIRNGGREERLVNQEATLAAREKQKLIKERFRAWLFSDPERTERLVRLYNDTYNNLRPRLFDGSHLDFPGMNQTVRLRAHQRNAIWRCMSAGNTLLAQAVGAGKTFTMAGTGMKMKQAGLIQKPMYVVPNHLLEQFGREFLHLYPNARLLMAGKDDLTRDRRKHLTAKIASGDWDGIIVTHSSFERIGMSRAYQEQFLNQQIQEYEQLLRDGASRDATRAHRNIIKTIEKQKAGRVERLQDLLAEEKKDDGLVFDELGVDHVFIDEAQYYKNLETPTKMERVAGIQTAGSERAFDVFMKARFLHERHPGHGVTFATGTPISNTMVEMYTMQRFLDPEGLRSRGLEHFDAWAATFGEVIDTMEITPDGASLRPRSRFARFTNLPELQQMFRSFADVQTAEMLDLPCPRLETGKPIVVACPMSKEQHALQQALVERYERLRSQKVDPREDNALNITTDGRKLAIDARMLSAQSSDFPASKVNALVERVAAIWNKTSPTRGTQMIFCDMGVHPTPWGYSAYDDVIQKLRVRGVPSEQIAAIGDADSDAKKQSLFEKVRSGQVRVLLGSTQKMGTGTNVQKRLAALHHLDAPWKPAEVEQREGRILRQGNENAEVSIYRYVTEGSFDAYMWQALETKARFIAQVITGESAVRRAEDIGGQELSYAEVKAIASGNPAVLTLAEADAELQRLAVLRKNHLDEQYVARRSVRSLPATIAELSDHLSKLTADGATATAHAAHTITIGSRDCSRDDATGLLAGQLDALPQLVREPRRVSLGIYRGLRFGLALHPQFPSEVFLEGAAEQRSMLSREHQGPRAVLNAVERMAKAYSAECERIRNEVAIAESQLRDYQARLGKPFLHDTVLSELADVRDQLKACLSGTDAELGEEARTGADALAERIKVLKAANAAGPMPERVGNRRSLAEEPVTARIRRNVAAILASELAHEIDVGANAV
jgi:N12 class adenine-specific DNA methylase